ncbi:hypothetical protein [Clostridium omnivorum]|uniref:Lipoprotein n=1 Tax=Clostridium omnivorum TaxID=1604902 RepID=A0ABQ5N1Y0_9CLOT|nr:hypothetical protein [Clostridium sp. E14]GLC29166.1 hypothetical protein bsdE14_05760 [Clostridium sp. E14]
MKKRYFKLVIIILNIFLLSSCSEKIKNNHIYVTQKNDESHVLVNSYPAVVTDGINPFSEIKLINEMEKIDNNMLIAISRDENIAFFIKRIWDKNSTTVIKGEPKERVRLEKVDRKNKSTQIISENMPFISLVRWNKDESMVAFGGEGKVFVYDLIKCELLNPPLMKDKEINYFGWSPDGKKLYLEDMLLANDSIWYIESGRIANSYETKEILFYKGNLDEHHYYGTKSIQTSQGMVTKTVAVDDKGEIVKDFPQGRFREAFGKSILLQNEKKDGLFLISDINKPKDRKLITKEYVYDCKFIADGRVAYTIKDSDIEKNDYILCIANKDGNTLIQLPVSGCYIAMQPDGKCGYIGGEYLEKVNFISLGIERKESLNIDIDSEQQGILKAVRGAVDTYYKFSKGLDKDNSMVEKYFSYASNPEQWAYFDILNVWNKKGIEQLATNENTYDIYLIDYKRYTENGEQAASVKLKCNVKDYDNRSKEEDLALELVNKNAKWYVVGFSTFPYSEEFKKMKLMTENFVKALKDGGLFEGSLKNKDIEIGQIQFWDKNKANLAVDAKEADSIKVYLKTKEGAKDTVYSLLINKNDKNSWEPVLLKKVE